MCSCNQAHNSHRLIDEMWWEYTCWWRNGVVPPIHKGYFESRKSTLWMGKTPFLHQSPPPPPIMRWGIDGRVLARIFGSTCGFDRWLQLWQVRGVCGAQVLPVFFVFLMGSSSIFWHRFLWVQASTACRLRDVGRAFFWMNIHYPPAPTIRRCYFTG